MLRIVRSANASSVSFLPCLSGRGEYPSVAAFCSGVSDEPGTSDSILSLRFCCSREGRTSPLRVAATFSGVSITPSTYSFHARLSMVSTVLATAGGTLALWMRDFSTAMTAFALGALPATSTSRAIACDRRTCTVRTRPAFSAALVLASCICRCAYSAALSPALRLVIRLSVGVSTATRL